MEDRFDMVTTANAVCVAAYVAITLGYVAFTISDFRAAGQ